MMFGRASADQLPTLHHRLTRLVTGWMPYWENKSGQGDGWKVVQDQLGMLDQVSFFSAQADPTTGTLTPNLGAPPDVLNQEVATLHNSDVASLVTVTQFDHVHELLSNPTALGELSDSIVSLVEEYGFDGVDIDFEDFTDKDSADTQRYTDFMTALANRLHRRKDSFGFPTLLAATILARTSRGRFTYADEGALAESPVDQVRIMAYDEFSPGSKTAGACAPLPWVEQVATYLRGLDVPTWKFIVGVPGYGYQWPVTSADDWTTTGKGTSVTYQKALTLMSQFHASREWSDKHAAPYFEYVDGGSTHVAFYADAENWRREISDVIAPESGETSQVGGIAEWALGYEDPQSWPVVRAELKQIYPVIAAIGLCYARFGGGGRFGVAVTPETNCGRQLTDGSHWRAGRMQQFEHGNLYYQWGSQRAFYVPLEVEALYDAQAGPDGQLGFPVADPTITANGSISQAFEGGTLTASPPQPAKRPVDYDKQIAIVLGAGTLCLAIYSVNENARQTNVSN